MRMMIHLSSTYCRARCFLRLHLFLLSSAVLFVDLLFFLSFFEENEIFYSYSVILYVQVMILKRHIFLLLFRTRKWKLLLQELCHPRKWSPLIFPDFKVFGDHLGRNPSASSHPSLFPLLINPLTLVLMQMMMWSNLTRSLPTLVSLSFQLRLSYSSTQGAVQANLAHGVWRFCLDIFSCPGNHLCLCLPLVHIFVYSLIASHLLFLFFSHFMRPVISLILKIL